MNLTDRGRRAKERRPSPISHRLSVLLIRPTLSQPRSRLRLAFDTVGQTRPGVAFGSRQPVEARHLPAKPDLNKGLDIGAMKNPAQQAVLAIVFIVAAVALGALWLVSSLSSGPTPPT